MLDQFNALGWAADPRFAVLPGCLTSPVGDGRSGGSLRSLACLAHHCLLAVLCPALPPHAEIADLATVRLSRADPVTLGPLAGEPCDGRTC